MKLKNEMIFNFAMQVKSVIAGTNEGVDSKGRDYSIRSFVLDGMVLDGINPMTNNVVDIDQYGTGLKKVIKVMNDKKIQVPLLDNNGNHKKDLLTKDYLFETENPTSLFGKFCQFEGKVSYYTSENGEVLPTVRITDFTVLNVPIKGTIETATLPSFPTEAQAKASGLFDESVETVGAASTNTISVLLGLSEADALALKQNNPAEYKSQLEELNKTARGLNKKAIVEELATV